MSVTFFGRRLDGSSVGLDVEHAVHLNMSCASARAFLLLRHRLRGFPSRAQSHEPPRPRGPLR